MTWRVAVANRGEIAVRTILACKELGYHAIALYSDADASSLPVRLADEAIRIGPAPAKESYLDANRVLAAALRARADALHPGYGFLAEDPELAERCRESGIVFVGPDAEVLRLAGDKIRAKAVAEENGLPVAPWMEARADNLDGVAGFVGRVGTPVLLKAASGGGGRGQAVLRDLSDLESTFEQVRRQAEQLWGDDRVLVEQFLEGGRHVEVQILADGRGRVVSLGTRDCSVQRKRQKFIEEAPAAAPLDLIEVLEDQARRLALAVGYRGVGTVEFLVDAQGRYAFLEINPRIQVEHTVTELVTGVDLLKAQLRIAKGEDLWLSQRDVHVRGHAVQVRLYAEDPYLGFVPSPGRILRLRLPEGPHVRVDFGYESGDEVPGAYDPLLAKIAVWGADRAEALVRMRRALDRLVVLGVKTNAGLLQRVLTDRVFRSGRVTTIYVEAALERLLDETPPTEVFGALLAEDSGQVPQATQPNGRRVSPWEALPGWRNGPNGVDSSEPEGTLHVLVSGRRHVVRYRRLARNVFRIQTPHYSAKVSFSLVAPGVFNVRCGGRSSLLHRIVDKDGTWVSYRGRTFWLEPRNDTPQARDEQTADSPELVAPTNAFVTAVRVSAGEQVERGQVVAVLEAMKLEMPVRAPTDGRVQEVFVQVGQTVRRGQRIATVLPEPGRKLRRDRAA